MLILDSIIVLITDIGRVPVNHVESVPGKILSFLAPRQVGLDALMTQLRTELHAITARYLANERANQTLQRRALVNEVAPVTPADVAILPRAYLDTNRSR